MCIRDRVDRAEVEVQQCMELTVTNRSRAYPERSSEDSKVDGVQYVILKVC